MSNIKNGKPDQPLFEDKYLRQPKKFNFWRGIYNKDKNYILGRTPSNWGRLFIFYAIFYILLAALFAVCMKGLLATLSDTEPKWQLDSSRIGSNPGLGFRPMSSNINHGSLIWFSSKDQRQVSHWSDLLTTFLEPYSKSSNNSIPQKPLNQIHCDFSNTQKGQNDVCSVDISHFGPCIQQNQFGFNNSAPCIFMKLNRIFNWVPEFYDDITNPLPHDMPEDLKEFIRQKPANERKQIWVSCKGEGSSDRDVLGPIKYLPTRGFPGYYYPYSNQPGYLSPLIAVHFERPELNRIINIECRAWAKNIIYNGSYRDRQGSVHFELMID